PYLNNNPRALPFTLPVSGSVDAGLLTRQLRVAAAWAGRCQPSAFCGGGGETRSKVELAGESARPILRVGVGPAEQLLQEADIQIATGGPRRTGCRTKFDRQPGWIRRRGYRTRV